MNIKKESLLTTGIFNFQKESLQEKLHCLNPGPSRISQVNGDSWNVFDKRIAFLTYKCEYCFTKN